MSEKINFRFTKVFVVEGIPFSNEAKDKIILAICTDYEKAKVFKERVLSSSCWFISVNINVFELDELNSFYS